MQEIKEKGLLYLSFSNSDSVSFLALEEKKFCVAHGLFWDFDSIIIAQKI